MSRCRRSLRATRAPCLAKSDQGERRGGGGSGTAGHPAVCRPAPHGKARFGRVPGARLTKRRTLAVLELATHSVGFGGRRVRLSVTSPSERCGTKPPASLRGTMENGPTGQMRSSNPPPGCGGVAPVNDLCSWPKGCLRRFAGMPMGSMQGYINWCVYPFRVNKAGDRWPKAPTFPKTHDVAGGS